MPLIAAKVLAKKHPDLLCKTDRGHVELSFESRRVASVDARCLSNGGVIPPSQGPLQYGVLVIRQDLIAKVDFLVWSKTFQVLSSCPDRHPHQWSAAWKQPSERLIT